MNKLILITLLILLALPDSLYSQHCLSSGRFIPKEQAYKNSIPKMDLLRVPIVFHFILREDTGTSFRITQVEDQLFRLNRDFNKENNNQYILPLELSGSAASANIEFYLPKKIVNGDTVMGINYVTTDVTEVGFYPTILFDDNEGGSTPWDQQKFINVYIGEMTPSILGYSTSPDSAGTTYDGIVINADYFGITAALPPYNLGRTLVHEIGHYLGLMHPWGQTKSDCDEFDQFTDTPPQQAPNYFCEEAAGNNCGELPTKGNFMDFLPDCCMAMFTNQQVAMMREVLETNREGLIEEDSLIESVNYAEKPEGVRVYPNPARSVCILKSREYAISRYDVIDSFGKLIVRKVISYPDLNQVQICLDAYPKGMLYLKVTDAVGNDWVKRVIHQ